MAKKAILHQYTLKANTDGTGESHTSVHFWWVVVIMTVVIITLLALLCTDIIECDRSIRAFLSFTATILSIVLSVFAIMYSYYSMIEAARQWHDVDKAVCVINASIETISNTILEQLKQIIDINRNLGSMQGKFEENNEINDNSDLNGNVNNVQSG